MSKKNSIVDKVHVLLEVVARKNKKTKNRKWTQKLHVNHAQNKNLEKMLYLTVVVWFSNMIHLNWHDYIEH